MAASRSPVDELGESAFAPGNLVAYHRPAVSRVLLSFADRRWERSLLNFAEWPCASLDLRGCLCRLFLAVAGFASAFKRDRTAFWFLLLIVTGRSGLRAQLRNCRGQGRLLFACIHFDRDCRRARYPLVDSTVLLQGVRRCGNRTVAAATAIVLTSATAFAANWPFNNRRHYFIAHDYAENLFSTIAPNGLLLTQDWQVASPNVVRARSRTTP